MAAVSSFMPAEGRRSIGRRSTTKRQAAKSLELLRRACHVEKLETRVLLSHAFTNSETTTLKSGLSQMADWMGDLAGLQYLGMSEQIQGVDLTMDQAVGLKDAFAAKVYAPVSAYLSAPGATDSGLSDLLKTLSSSSANLTFTVHATTGGGLVSGAHGSSYEYDLAFDVQRTSNAAIDLGDRWHALNMVPDASGVVNFTGSANVDLHFGVGQANYTAAPNSFYTRFDTLSYGGSAHASNLNFGLNIGMLGGQVVNGALDVTASESLAVADPDGDAAGAITAAELQATPWASFVAGTPLGTANISLPIQASFGSFVPTGTPQVSLVTYNIYARPAVQMGNNADFDQIAGFGSMSPADVVLAVKQIGTSFSTIVSGSSLGLTTVPFVPSKSLANTLGFAELLNSQVVGVLSNGGGPTFGNAQSLESVWAASLGVAPASLAGSYDPATHLLTWHIAASRLNANSTSSIGLSGLSPLTLKSSSGTVYLTSNASLDTVIGLRLEPMAAKITGGAALPGNGQFVGTASFTITVGDEAPVSIAVAGAATAGNAHIDDLIDNFNAALASAGLWKRVYAVRTATRLSFATAGGMVIPKITLHTDPHNVMATQFGFVDGQTDQGSVLPQVYLQNTAMSGSVAGNVSGVSASGQFGLLGAGVVGGSGTMSMTGGMELWAPGNQVAGSQVTADDLAQKAASSPGSFAKSLSIDGNASLTLPITVTGGFLPVSGSPTVTVTWTHAPNPAFMVVSYNADMAPLLDFAKLKSSDILASLTGIGSLLGLAESGSVFTQKLPLVDRSVAGMLDLSGLVATKLSTLALSPFKTVQDVSLALNSAFSPRAGSLNVYMDGHLLRITFSVNAAASGSDTLTLHLDQLVAELPANDPARDYLQGIAKLVGSGASGKLPWSANATLNVAAGVDLTDPAHPKPFIDDSTHTTVNVEVNGTNLSFGATMGPLGVKIAGGSAKIGETLFPGADAASFSIGVTPSGTGRHTLSEINAGAFTATAHGALHATLPLYFPSAVDFIGNLIVSASDLGDIPGSLTVSSPNIHQIGLDMDLSNNMDGLLEGLNSLLDQMQSSIGQQALSKYPLPLVGTQLSSAVDFIGGELRTKLYDKLKAAFDNAEALGQKRSVDVARQALYDALGSGPGGLHVLQSLTSYGDYRDISYTPTGSGIATSRVEFNLHLVAPQASSGDVDFDLGLASLGLKRSGEVTVTADYDINLAFGIDKSIGFFLDAGSANEVKIQVDAALKQATKGGSLGDLKFDMTDGSAGTPASRFSGEYDIDLRTALPSGLIGQNDLASIDGASFIHAQLDGSANVNLHLVTALGSSAAFPSLETDLAVNWSFSGADLRGNVPTVTFTNVRMDAGAFLGSFMGPIMTKIEAVIDPIAPVLKALTTDIPGLAEVAPQWRNLIEIAQSAGYVEGAAGVEALGHIADLVAAYENLTETTAGEHFINLGSFDLGGLDPRTALDGSATFNPDLVDPNVLDDKGDASNQLPNDAATQTFWNDTQSVGGQGIKMQFPILQTPSEAFKLLLGQDVNLFTLDIPAVHLTWRDEVEVPIWSNAFVTVNLDLGGTLDLQGKVAFGYDTSGLRELMSDPAAKASDVFDGFYISTQRNADGTGGDMPFMVAQGEVRAGLSATVAGLISVGGDGGLGLSVSAYLQDPNRDGKLHVNEMISEADNGILSTVKITGSIYALFEVEFSIPILGIDVNLFRTTFPLVDLKLLSPATIGADSFAPNSKMQSAADVGVGPGIHLTSLSLKKSENDWFTFQLLRPDSINVATADWSELNTITEVYDDHGHLLASTLGDSQQAKTVTLEGLDAGRYYIHVSGDGASGSDSIAEPYSLAVDPAASSNTHVFYVSSPVPLHPSIEGMDQEPRVYSTGWGIDANDGKSAAFPKATLTGLLDQLEKEHYILGPNDLILIDTGTYIDSPILGQSVAGAIIAGSPRGTVYTARDQIDPQTKDPEPLVRWTIDGGTNNRITGIQFDHFGDVWAVAAVTLKSGSGNTLDHLQIRGYSYGIEDAATNDKILNNQILATCGVVIDASAVGTLVQDNAMTTSGTGIVDGGHEITIKGNNVRGFSRFESSPVAMEITAGDVVVSGNTFRFTSSGIAVNANDGTILISGNTLLGTKLTYKIPPTGISLKGSSSVHVTGNLIRDFQIGVEVEADGAAIDSNSISNGQIGVEIMASGTTLGPANDAEFANDIQKYNAYGVWIKPGYGSNHIVGNRIHDNGAGIKSDSAGMIYGNDIFANTTGIISSDGMIGGFDWGAPNLVHDNQSGIEIGSGTVQFNRIYANTEAGITVGDNANVNHNVLYRNTGNSILDAGHANVAIVSNTIYLASGVGLEIEQGASGTLVRNNIFMAAGSGYDMKVATDSQTGLVSDYNNFYRTGGGVLVWFEKDFSDLYDWQIESDFDLHSIGYIAPSPSLDNPQFSDLGNDDFTLKAASTSIDSGYPGSSYSLEPGPNGNRIDLGAYGNSAAATPSASSYIRVDYPNLYVDWEANRARKISWHTYNVTGDVRLELWQEGGGKVADIAVVPASDGSYLWSPNNSGIVPDAVKRYRIHIVSLSGGNVAGTAREFFSVPPESSNYFINDSGTSFDEYTSTIGNNRNTGRASNAPKADLLPILRSYPLSANDIIHVDTGSYIDVRNLVINYNVDVNQPNAGTGLGDDQGFSVVGPISGWATLDRANSNANTTHIDVDAANFVSLSHLKFLGGSAGINAHNSSRNFNADHVEVGSTGGDGIALDSGAVNSTLDSLTVHDNAGYGVWAQAQIASLSNSLVYNSGRDGIRLDFADGTVVQRNTVHDNGVEIGPGGIRNDSGFGINATVHGTSGVVIGSLILSDYDGNIVYDNGYGGINVSGSAPSGNVIAGNVVYGNTGTAHAGIQTSGSKDHIFGNVVYGNDIGILAYADAQIQRNRASDNARAGIEIRSNSTVELNTVTGNGIGIYLVAGYSGGYPTIINDTVIDSMQAGIQLSGASAGYAASGTPPHALIQSNTIYQSTGGTGVLVTGSSNSVEIRNNIIDVSKGSGAITVSRDSQVGFVSDFNLFNTAAGIPIGTWQDAALDTLVQWRNATYGDVESITGIPQFVNPATGDFHLQSQYGSNHGGSAAAILDGFALPDFASGYWATDSYTSPAIDRGDASLPFANEPAANGNYANIGAESNTSMASKSPSNYVLVTSPSDGVIWPDGQTYNIQWRTQVANGTVRIELLKGGEAVLIAPSALNTGTYAWHVPAGLDTGDYAVRVSRNDGSGTAGDSATFVIAAVTHTYFVSTSGNDANSGLDAANPKSSIRGVFFSYHVGFGDTIEVGGGTYALTTNIFLDASLSGITIEGSHSAANPTILDRQNTSFGAYVFQMAGASYVTLDHLTMTGAHTAVWDDYSDSADHLTITNSDFHDNAFAGINLQSASNTLIGSNTFEGNPASGQAWHLYIRGDDNTISGNTITGHCMGDDGVAISATGARMHVLSNLVYDTSGGIQVSLNAPLQPTTADLSYVSGNFVQNLTSGGLSVGGYAIVSHNAVSNTHGQYGGLNVGGVAGAIVSNNTVHDSAGDGLTVSGVARVTGNSTYHNAGAGISALAYHYDDILIQGNTSYANATGISATGAILNNTIYHNTVQGILVSGGTRTTILNNTIDEVSGAGIALRSSASNVDVRNTIIVVGFGAAYSVSPDSQGGFTADYNIVNTYGFGEVASWGAYHYLNLSAWNNALGFDAHSLGVDPRFTGNGYHLSDGTGGEFPTPSSPAIDAGDPASYYLSEPQPNGNRVNIGADGNTAQANLSISPAIQVTSPAAGEQLQEGQTYNVTWLSTGLALQTPVAFVDSGGMGTGKWSADNYYQLASGSTYTSNTANSIDTTGLTNPAPQSVYQSSLGTQGSTIGYELAVPDGTYTLRLHFAELAQYASAGVRTFDIVINGTTVQAGYDILAQTGAVYKADIRQFTVVASGGTGIHLRLNATGEWNPCISGIELSAANVTGYPSPRFNIEVSVDSGAHWYDVASNVLADRYGNGSYLWSVGPDGNKALLRITSANDGSVAAESQPFQIAPPGHLFYINDNSTDGDEHATQPGNDLNDGKSPETPMATLSALLAAYTPHAGDTIYIDSGSYTLASAILLNSAYSGVKIIGPTAHQALFDRNSTSYGSYAFEISGASDITISNLSITGAYEGIHADQTYGTPSTGLTLTNNVIYGNYQYGINVLQGNDNAVISGNTVYGIPGDWSATTLQTYGIALGASGGTVTNNTVYNSDQYGIYVSSFGANTISGNRVYNTVAGKGTYGIYVYGPGTLIGNTVLGQTNPSQYGGYGIYLTGGATARANTVYGNHIGIAASGANTIVSGNRAYNNFGYGLSVSPDVRTLNNIVYSNDVGIYISGSPDLNGRVSGNLVYANSGAGIESYAVSYNSNTGAHLQISGNTIYQPSADGIQIIGSTSVELRNNIISVGAGYALSVDGDSTASLASDYNLFYATGGGQLGRFSNVTLNTLDDWYANTLQDDHSGFGDPLFISPAGIDGILGYGGGSDHSADDTFHLMGTSPAIDAGDPVTPYLSEPQPNGGRVNIGYDGNTSAAASSDATRIVFSNPSGHQRLTVGQPTTIRWSSTGLTLQSPVALINCGGAAVGSFSANSYLTSGSTQTNYYPADTSGIVDPAPAAVYQSYASASYGAGQKLQYDLPLPDGTYTLRLHFDDPSYAPRYRRFDIRLNGVTVRSAYDISADAGTGNKVVQQTFTVTASGGSGVRIELVNLDNSPAILSAFEVLRDNADGAAAPTFTLQVTTNSGLTWNTLATGLAANHLGEGSFTWTPNAASPNAIFRISSGHALVVDSTPVVIAPAGHDFYINDGSTSGDALPAAIGDNSNSGKSPDKPMASLQELLALYSPTVGDVVHIENGSYTVARNITLGSADKGVLIQGPSSGQALFTRSFRNGSVKSAVFQTSGGVANVTLDRLAMTGADYGVWGPYDYYNQVSSHLTISNSTIYNTQTGVYLDTHNDFAAVTNSSIYSNQSNGITVIGNDATISGNNVHGNSFINISVSGYRELVQNNTVWAGYGGVSDSGASSSQGTLISGNSVYSNSQYGIMTGATSTQIVGNVVYGQSASGATGLLGTGQFTGNTVYNNDYGITAYSNGANQSTVSGNRVYHNITQGISINGNGVVSRNRVYSNPIGIRADGSSGSQFTGRIENNLVYANSSQGIQINYGGSVSNVYGVIYTYPAQITNNTIYQPVGDGVRLLNSSVVNIEDNIIQANTGYGIYADSNSQVSGITSDYNLFVRQLTLASRVAYWGGDLATLDDWKATGRDLHSRTTTDARFINIVGADNVFAYDTTQGIDGGSDDNFQLSANSAAIDAGTEWAGAAADILGHGRVDDRGIANSGSNQIVYSQLSFNYFNSLGGVSQGWSGSYTYWTLNLPFAFRFYDQTYSQVYVSSSGFLQFGSNTSAGDPSNSTSSLMSSPRIAPMWDWLNTSAVYVDTSISNQVTIRWTGTQLNSYFPTPVNFATTLFNDGSIRFEYGSGNSNLSPTVGISAGDGVHYRLAQYDGSTSLYGAYSLKFDRSSKGFTDLGAYEFSGDSSDATPTVLTGITPSLIGLGGVAHLPINSITLSFNHALSAVDALAAGLFDLRSAGIDGNYGTADDTIYTLIPQYAADSTSLTLNILNGPLPQGSYRFTTYATGSRALHDINGQAIDGDGSGLAGGNYARDFVVGSPAVAPAISVTAAPLPINEGVPFVQDGSFTDPDSSDSWTATVSYGDMTGSQVLALNADMTFHLAHSYADNGTYTITVTISDSFGLSDSRTITQVVNEVAPTATFGNSGPLQEGAGAMVSFGNAMDPSARDASYLRYSYDFNNDGTFEVLYATLATVAVPANYLPIGGGSRVVHGRISTSNDGAYTDYTTTITVNNVLPGIVAGLDAAITTWQTYTAAGSFTDPGTAETYTATVDYGDGSGEQPLTLNLDRTFSLEHSYDVPGSYQVIVSISDGDAVSATAMGSVIVSAPAVMPANGIDISCTTFAGFIGAIASFTPFPGTFASEYQVTADFGDGVGDGYAWVLDGGDGKFYVQASKTYSTAGTFNISVYVEHPTLGYANASSTATVAAPTYVDLAPTGVDIAPFRGQYFTGAVALFTPVEGTTTANYTAMVDWGDGGGIVVLSLAGNAGTNFREGGSGWVIDNEDGTFAVYGSHTYFSQGTFSITTRVIDGPFISGTIVSTATVVNPPPSLAVFGLYTTQYETLDNVEVAYFSDQYPAADLSSYSATIDWGDHQSSPGTIQRMDGYYAVFGSHTYNSFGGITLAVTLQKSVPDAVPQVVRSSSNIFVGEIGWDLALESFSALTRVSAPVTVARLTLDAGDSPASYTASIDWGNGQAAAGTIVADQANPGQYLVRGTTKYAADGDYTVAVRVIHHGYGVNADQWDLTSIVHVSRPVAVATLGTPPATIVYDGKTDIDSWAVAKLTVPPDAPAATGVPTVRFYAGPQATGTPMASLPVNAGTYTALALYAGDANYAPAQSAAVTFTIGRAPATVALPAAPVSITYTGNSDVTSWVKATLAGIVGAPAPTGGITYTYYAGSAASGAPLASAPTAVGTYTVVATYAGNSNYQPATSAPVTFTISAPVAPLSSFFKVNDGSAQRSMVTFLAVSFSSAVTLQPGAITLTDKGGNAVAFDLQTADNVVFTLRFLGNQFVGHSLANGRYVVTVKKALVAGIAGGAVLASDQVYNFWRLFGDYYGTAIVNNADKALYTQAYKGTASSAVSAFDYDGDGLLTAADTAAFNLNFGKSI